MSRSSSAGSEPLNRPQVPALTGLRFLAALLVLVGHAGQMILAFPGDSKSYGLFWAASACLGMSLFFVLSGFVIHYNYAQLFLKEPPTRALYSFLANRIARLYPLFFFIMLVNLAVSPLKPHLGAFKYLLPQYLTLSQSWVFAVTGDGQLSFSPFYSQSWSISVEFFFYLLFPLVVVPITWLGGRDGGAFASPWRRLKPAATVWILALFGGYAIAWGCYQSRSLTFPLAGVLSMEHPLGEEQYTNWLSYFCPLVRFVEFLVGCLTAQLYLVTRDLPPTHREKRLGGGIGLLALVAIVLLHCLFFLASPQMSDGFFGFLRMSFLWGGPLAVVIFCCVRYPSVLSRWLDWPAVVLLGEASYSIYLLQQLLLWSFAKGNTQILTVPVLLQRLFTFGVAIAAVLLVALGTYRAIEDPARRWLRGLLGRLPLDADGPALRRAVLAIYLTPVLGLGLSFLIYRVSYLPSGFLALAELKQKEGELEEAVTALDRALQLRPRYVGAMRKRAEIQLALGNASAALVDLDRVLQLEPDQAKVWYSRGQAHLLLGEREAAEADLTRALTIDPDLKAGYRLRGQLRKERGDRAGATADFKQARQHPSDPTSPPSRKQAHGPVT